MAIVVPGKCWASHRNWDESGIYYGTLGPFAEGDYIRRVTMMVSGLTVGNGRFAASLGRSSDPTEASLASGIQLIQRSDFAIRGVPHIFWAYQAYGQTTIVIPVGIGGDVGSRYVVFVFNPIVPEASGMGIATAEVLRFSKGPKEKREE